MKKPFKDFDLPKHHLTAERHYVPPKARRSSEIERRHELPTGTVLAEHQTGGLAIASYVLDVVEGETNRGYAAKLFGASAVNTAWYGYGRFSDVMRRRLKLPYMADLPEDYDADRALSYDLRDTVQMADHFTGLVTDRKAGVAKARVALGRQVGEVGLSLACVGMKPPSFDTPFAIQTCVREASLQLMNEAQALTAEIGTPPSFAQLPDVDSDLSLHIRRTAPNGVYQAYADALDNFRIEV